MTDTPFLRIISQMLLIILIPLFSFCQIHESSLNLINGDATSFYQPEQQAVKGTKRWQTVHINPIQGNDQIYLNLFDQPVMEGKLMRVDKHLCGILSYTYRLDKQKWGYFILSEKKGKLMGKIETDAGQIYIISPMETKPYYLLKELEYELQDEGCTHSTDENDRPEDALEDQIASDATTICDPSATCPTQMIKILVVYSAAARSDMGGNSRDRDGNSQCRIRNEFDQYQ